MSHVSVDAAILFCVCCRFVIAILKQQLSAYLGSNRFLRLRLTLHGGVSVNVDVATYYKWLFVHVGHFYLLCTDYLF